jgi:hypothetical protein
VCAIYRPSAPLANGHHSLLAYVEDAGGNVLAQANVDFVVDTTPPDTSVGSLGGTALRPSFSFTIDEDDAFDQGDSVQCSLTPVSAPPAWSTCASGLRGGAGGSFISPSALPKRHVDYRFEARGVDDFGRPDPTPAQVEFDPVPCTIKAGSITIAKLITTGIPLTLSCSYLHDVQLDFFLLGKNGHRKSIGYVVNAFQNLGFQEIKKPATHFTVHRKLRLFKPFAPYFRSYRSAALVIRARDGQGEAGLPAYAVITARR